MGWCVARWCFVAWRPGDWSQETEGFNAAGFRTENVGRVRPVWPSALLRNSGRSCLMADVGYADGRPQVK